MLDLRDSEAGCLLPVRVQPNAKKSALAGIFDQSLKVALQAPAVEGKANKALIAFIAKLACVSPGRVRIVRGEKSREKSVLVEGVSAAAMRTHLINAGADPTIFEQETR